MSCWYLHWGSGSVRVIQRLLVKVRTLHWDQRHNVYHCAFLWTDPRAQFEDGEGRREGEVDDGTQTGHGERRGQAARWMAGRVLLVNHQQPFNVLRTAVKFFNVISAMSGLSRKQCTSKRVPCVSYMLVVMLGIMLNYYNFWKNKTCPTTSSLLHCAPQSSLLSIIIHVW